MAPKKPKRSYGEDQKLAIFYDFEQGLSNEELMEKYNAADLTVIERVVEELLESKETHGKF